MILRNTFIVFLLLPLLLSFTYCSGSKSDQKQTNIPTYVLESGKRFISSKTGKSFFDNYIQPDYDNCRKTEKGYFLSYKLIIPEKPFVNGQIRFTVDTLGNVIQTLEIFGIPDCIKNPEDCQFNIDEKSARAIAEQNGLEKGVKDWKVTFLFDPMIGKYVWNINTTISQSEGEFGYRASGKEMIIDSSSGEVLFINEWKIN